MKTLIVYATNTGTAEKAAQMLNERLKDKADIINLKKEKAPNISAYDFVVIGGSIIMGRIQRNVKRFIAKNKGALLEKPMGLFIACGYPENLQDYFNVILGDLRPHAAFEANIGYAYYLEKANPIAKQVMISLAHTTETTEAFDEKEIQRMAEIINKK